jgi:superfamily II DNA/RNA helicase
MTSTNFKSLHLIEPLLLALYEEGYTTPTPIQAQSIPIVLEGKDLLGCAQTGTGKTAAFTLPILQLLLQNAGNEKRKKIRSLIVTPTRELAIQIAESFNAYGRHTPLSCTVIFGGVAQGPQVTALRNGVDVVIATPGRLLDLMNQGHISLRDVEIFVLDEADRMLDMGFSDDLSKIITFLPAVRQNLLFSATMPSKMRVLAKKLLHNPVEINIAISKPPEQIVQKAFIVYEAQKVPIIIDMLSSKKFSKVIVFCSKKLNVKQLTAKLKSANLMVAEIHSDLDQKSREQYLQDFRNQKINILVATDVLSRGIDIDDIDLVINYDVPNDGEDYIHRIGRTARAATSGTAFTLVDEKEQGKCAVIEQLLGAPILKGNVPAEFGPTPNYNPKSIPQKGFNRRR